MGPTGEWEMGTRGFRDNGAWLNRLLQQSSQQPRSMPHGTYTICHQHCHNSHCFPKGQISNSRFYVT
ncbi:hypothetical protein GYH30_002277 [Glycine max]|nr:hypothetical protein GYH30_002277 [Glycine max]